MGLPLQLSNEEFEELDISCDAICEENEKYRSNELFFLTVSLESAQSMIDLCNKIISDRKLDPNHNYLCGRCMFLVSGPDNIIKRGLMPEKEKEIRLLEKIVDKAMLYQDQLLEGNMRVLKPCLRIHTAIKEYLTSLIEEIIEKDNIREIYTKIPEDKYLAITSFLMSSGKYGNEIYQFFIDNFIKN